MQTLRDVVTVLDELSDDATIYTDGVTPAARATVVSSEADEADAARRACATSWRWLSQRRRLRFGVSGAGRRSPRSTTS